MRVVKADIQDKRVQVLVDGPIGSRRRLLAVIRSDLDRIHASIPELKPRQMVPVPGHANYLIEYQKLVILEQKGRNTFEELVGDDLVSINVTTLLNGVDLSPQLRPGDLTTDSACKVFYSFCHKDERLRSEMESHLKILERRLLISSWHDRLIRPGDKWANEIDENLESADIILLLVSADFIASEYCYSKEMDRALERQKAGDALVIPVILRDCNWKNAPFGNLQGLPKNFKPIKKWTDRDSAWRNVSEGIEDAVKRIRVGRPGKTLI